MSQISTQQYFIIFNAKLIIPGLGISHDSILLLISDDAILCCLDLSLYLIWRRRCRWRRELGVQRNYIICCFGSIMLRRQMRIAVTISTEPDLKVETDTKILEYFLVLVFLSPIGFQLTKALRLPLFKYLKQQHLKI